MEDSGYVDSGVIFSKFEKILEPFDFQDCRIIQPHQVANATPIYESIKIEFKKEAFGKRLEIDKMVNVNPKT